MPIKRNTPSPTKRSPSSNGKRVVRRVLKRAASAPAPDPTPRMLSAEEKRQLILAHAAMRRPHDPVQMMSLWAGVAMTVLVLVIGYWYAVTPSFVEASRQPFDTELAPAVDNLKDFAGKMKDLPDLVKHRSQQPQTKQTLDQLDQLQQEAIARQRALEEMAGMMNATSDALIRTNLFQPSSTSTDQNALPSTP